MKMLLFAFFIAAFLHRPCVAWKCDARCNLAAYVACLEEEEAKDGGRALYEIDHLMMMKEKPRSSSLQPLPPSNTRLLRGSHRHLDDDTIYFQLKLHHEPGYCWQAEWEDRMWCAECINDCEDWDYLELKFCKADRDKQFFTYEPMPNGIGGRIKPMTNLSLCWERTRVNAHQLRPCDDINGVVNVTQIFRDFDMFRPFELHPFNRGDNTTHPDGPMCLANHHHPKSEEVIRAEKCDGARADNSSFWVAYNAYTEAGPLVVDTPSPTVSSPAPSETPVATPAPTDWPSWAPVESSVQETETSSPTDWPTVPPTDTPVQTTPSPVTPAPVASTPSPTAPPTAAPTIPPTTSPTSPPTAAPTAFPTPAPVIATPAPTDWPSLAPVETSEQATETSSPTDWPTVSPTNTPTVTPTASPTILPTTVSPTLSPTVSPTVSQTSSPTASPTQAPSFGPSEGIEPTAPPMERPSPSPTVSPTATPTAAPVDPTSAPVDHTAAPVAPTNPPVEPTSAPIDPTSVPVAPTNPPVDPTSAPDTQASETLAPTTVDPMSAPTPRPPPTTEAPPPTPAETVQTDDLIPVLDLGWDSCTIFDKCPQCTGDCDNDDECEGSLICFKRSTNSPVPSCSGGELVTHEKDFCISPVWDGR